MVVVVCDGGVDLGAEEFIDTADNETCADNDALPRARD